MKRHSLKALSLALVCALSAALAACGGGQDSSSVPGQNSSSSGEQYRPYDYTAEHTSTDRKITFVSSDTALDSVLNEYRERHMRENPDMQIHNLPVGAGGTAWKEWESMIGSWWDASHENGTMSEFYATKERVNGWLSSAVMDRQGYVWTDDGTRLDGWMLGWEFPDYREGGIGWSTDISTTAEPHKTTAQKWDGWTASGGAASSEGFYRTVSANGADKVEFVSPDFVVSTTVTPFLRLNVSFLPENGGDIEDLYVYYKTDQDPGWTEDKKVSFSKFALNGYEIGSKGISERGYAFPMYLHEKWGWEAESGRHVTGLKIVLKAKAGGKVSGKLKFGYVATDYDDRHTNNVCNYILAAREMIGYSQDKQMLAAVMPKARAAMNFLLNQLGGKSGLISTDYIKGHYNDRSGATGASMGNGYWDALAFPKVNLYCNLSFYGALKGMVYLEGLCEYYGLDLPETTTLGADMTETLVYAETEDSLARLEKSCREKMRTYFWNEKTGRFHAGYIDDPETEELADREIQDNGYVLFNQQAIIEGIATQEQTKSIMSWINGEREVTRDDSTGADIYRYEFAPRFNTKDIGFDFYWNFSARFDGNVENGGTALELAYYDIVSQAALGADAAYKRLDAFRCWYEKVRAAGGTGWKFYRAYYDTLGDVGVQGGGSSGTIGLDYEFLEAALMFKAVPTAFFGLGTGAENTLLVSPALPSEMDFWRMENLTYAGRYYDLSVGKYFAQISGVEDYRKDVAGAADAKVRFTFKQPSFKFKIYLDGEEITDYTAEDGKVTVTAAFRAAKVEIRPA